MAGSFKLPVFFSFSFPTGKETRKEAKEKEKRKFKQ